MEKKIKNVNNKSLINIFLFVVLFLFWTNFLGAEEFFLALIMVTVLYIIVVNGIEFNLTFFVLFSFLFLHYMISFFYEFDNILHSIISIVNPLVFYILGYSFVKFNSYKIDIFKKFLLTILLSHFIYGLLTFLKTYFMTNGNLGIPGFRVTYDLWSGNLLNATNFNSFLSFSITLAPVIFFKIKKLSMILKYSLIFCFIVGTVEAFWLGNRTALLLIIISLIATCILEWKKIKNIKFIIFFVGVLIVMFTIYFLNVFNIATLLLNSPVFQRVGGSNSGSDPRFEAWQTALIGLFDFPMGGKLTNINLNYVHNLWLDVGYNTGVIPLFLLIMFTTFSLLSIYKFIKNNYSDEVNILVIGFMVAFFVTFTLEPIINGYTKYFMTFCLFIGATQSMNNGKKLQKVDEK